MQFKAASTNERSTLTSFEPNESISLRYDSHVIDRIRSDSIPTKDQFQTTRREKEAIVGASGLVSISDRI